MTESTRPTIYDVGRKAHVSHGTVSRVINDRPNVAPATRALVREAMKDLGFTRNDSAFRLRSAEDPGNRIGVIVEQLNEVGPSGNMVAALAELQAAGYRFDLVAANGKDVARSVEQALRQLDGLTVGILALAQTQEAREALLANPLAVPVYIERFLDRGSSDQPGAEELIGRVAAEHLEQRGHRRVLHLPGPTSALSAQYRQGAFVARGRELGMIIEIGRSGDWTSASGYDLAATIDADAYSAVFVANDAMAIGLLHGLRRRSIDVPARLAILGVDDVPEAQHTDPQLSSVRHDLAAEGRLAARMLISAIRKTPEPDPTQYLHVRVEARASTALQIAAQ